MSARWAETGVGVVRDEDGVWRQYGDTHEFTDPAASIREEGEEEAAEAALHVDHNAGEGFAFLGNSCPSTGSPDDDLLSPWELELEREATIEGLERKITEDEKALRVLQAGKVVLRGKPQRLAQLRENLARLKRELEEERAASCSFPKPGPVEVVFHRHIPTHTIRARRPRDPNKIQ